MNGGIKEKTEWWEGWEKYQILYINNLILLSTSNVHEIICLNL